MGFFYSLAHSYVLLIGETFNRFSFGEIYGMPIVNPRKSSKIPTSPVSNGICHRTDCSLSANFCGIIHDKPSAGRVPKPKNSIYRAHLTGSKKSALAARATSSP